MKETYFKELARVLNKQGIQTKMEGDEGFQVLMDGQTVCHVGASGSLYFREDYLTGEESDRLTELLHPTCYQTHEYTTLMENAPLVKSDSGNADFKLLADFGGAILAGKELENGYQFATWEKDGSGKGYNYGHYFDDSYTSAKEDFATRSGLVHRDKLFSESEMTVIHKAMKSALEDGIVFSYDEEALAEELCETLEYFHPHLKDEQPTMTDGPNMEQSM